MDQQQPVYHPINLAAVMAMFGQIEKAEGLNRAEDVIGKLQMAALASIAVDLRRLADFTTRMPLPDSPIPGLNAPAEEPEPAEGIAEPVDDTDEAEEYEPHAA